MKEAYYPQNISKMFLESVNRFGEDTALVYKENHHFDSLTYKELKNFIEIAASALKSKGIGQGDKVMIISENRPEWVMTDLSVTMLGAVTVPIHEVLSAHQIEDIISEIKPRAVFVSGEDVLQKIQTDRSKFFIVSFENLGKKATYFKDMIDSHKDRCVIEKEAEKIMPDDVASIIYTSGTTGNFKGVPLTHRNFMSNVVEVNGVVPTFPTDRLFSILPLSHVFERTIGYYIPLYCGASIGYSTDLKNISSELKDRKPTIVIAVPRLFEKIYEKVNDKANKNVFKKTIFSMAQKVGKNSPLYSLFDKLVYSKIRDEFGGCVRFFVSGGAPLPTHLGEFFDKVTLTVLEGYGLTECSPVVTLNPLEKYKFGTVGKVLPGTEVEISQDGEIMVKGPGVTGGYLESKFNAESFEGGWFKTGDLGSFDKEGFLTITGRKKDLMVLSTGKKVAPAHVEGVLELCPYVEQAMIFGEGKKHVGAFIVPNFEKLAEVFSGKTKKQLVNDAEAVAFMKEEIKKISEPLASYEKVYKFTLLLKPFSVEGGELTPTLKLRRHMIYEANREMAEALY